MLVDFNELPDSSRIWIYPSNRNFTEDEQAELRVRIASFLEEWTAHGQSLKAGFEVKYFQSFRNLKLGCEKNS